MWALGTWSHLKVVWVSEHVQDALYCWCLAVRGLMLLCSGECKGYVHGFMVVLEVNIHSCQHTLQLDSPVRCLARQRMGHILEQQCGSVGQG